MSQTAHAAALYRLTLADRDQAPGDVAVAPAADGAIRVEYEAPAQESDQRDAFYAVAEAFYGVLTGSDATAARLEAIARDAETGDELLTFTIEREWVDEHMRGAGADPAALLERIVDENEDLEP